MAITFIKDLPEVVKVFNNNIVRFKTDLSTAVRAEIVITETPPAQAGYEPAEYKFSVDPSPEGVFSFNFKNIVNYFRDTSVPDSPYFGIFRDQDSGNNGFFTADVSYKIIVPAEGTIKPKFLSRLGSGVQSGEPEIHEEVKKSAFFLLARDSVNDFNRGLVVTYSHH